MRQTCVLNVASLVNNHPAVSDNLNFDLGVLTHYKKSKSYAR